MNEFEKKIATRLQGFVDALETETVADKFTCHTVMLDLEPGEYDPQKVVSVRRKLGASQAIFAKLLGLSVKTVSSWEQGKSHPTVMACRFMDEISLDIERWQKRLQEAVRIKKTKSKGTKQSASS